MGFVAVEETKPALAALIMCTNGESGSTKLGIISRN